jgi:hypothetical protein
MGRMQGLIQASNILADMVSLNGVSALKRKGISKAFISEYGCH